MTELLDRYLRRVTRVNGMEVRRSGKFFDAYDPDTGEVIATVTSSRTKTAADMLIEAVYRHNCRIVYERQKGLCWSCGQRRALEFDHIVARSKGRDDRVSNLRAVCSGMAGGCYFHRRRHGG